MEVIPGVNVASAITPRSNAVLFRDRVATSITASNQSIHRACDGLEPVGGVTLRRFVSGMSEDFSLISPASDRAFRSADLRAVNRNTDPGGAGRPLGEV